MSKPVTTPSFKYRSCLALWFSRFVQEKQALGFPYRNGASLLRHLDALLLKKGSHIEELPKPIVEEWLKAEPHFSARTLEIRYSLTRQFALFLIRNGIPAYVPPAKEGPIVCKDYVPYIFSREEIRKILTVADSLPPYNSAPLYHLIYPEVLRLLYGCGLRINEVLQLQVKDLDLSEGVLTVREGKGGNDRLVPLPSSLKDRLTRYDKLMGNRSGEAPFFSAPDGRFYRGSSIYCGFRNILWRAGIHYGGRGRGPRLHDLRHTMACHRLIKWYREGADFNAKLPILATFLGHKNLSGTQHYLHLTAEIFPDLTLNSESVANTIIPRRNEP